MKCLTKGWGMKEKIVTPIIAEVLYRDVRDLKEKKNQPTI